MLLLAVKLYYTTLASLVFFAQIPGVICCPFVMTAPILMKRFEQSQDEQQISVGVLLLALATLLHARCCFGVAKDRRGWRHVLKVSFQGPSMFCEMKKTMAA